MSCSSTLPIINEPHPNASVCIYQTNIVCGCIILLAKQMITSFYYSKNRYRLSISNKYGIRIFLITHGRLNAYAQMIMLIEYFKNRISNSFIFPTREISWSTLKIFFLYISYTRTSLHNYLFNDYTQFCVAKCGWRKVHFWG